MRTSQDEFSLVGQERGTPWAIQINTKSTTQSQGCVHHHKSTDVILYYSIIDKLNYTSTFPKKTKVTLKSLSTIVEYNNLFSSVLLSPVSLFRDSPGWTETQNLFLSAKITDMHHYTQLDTDVSVVVCGLKHHFKMAYVFSFL